MEVPDSIRKELVLAASRERVWEALTDPAQLVLWFPTHDARIDLRPGGALRLAWEADADEGVVDEVSPGERLVFRWRSQGTDDPYTRVSITLEDVPAGTQLVLIEEGFSAFSADKRDDMVAGNTKGWSEELEELRGLLETRAA